jgi:hypothetical protein
MDVVEAFESHYSLDRCTYSDDETNLGLRDGRLVNGWMNEITVEMLTVRFVI